MNMYELLVLINVFMLGWIACRVYMAYKLTKAIEQLAKLHNFDIKDLDETLTAKEKVIKVPTLFTEMQGNSIMLYNKDTEQFVSQAYTLEDLAENMLSHNKINFALVHHKNELVWFVEGKVRKDLNQI